MTVKKPRLLCLLLTLLLFAGCAPAPESPSDTPSAPSEQPSEPVTPPVTPVFELPELPEIGEYDAVTVKRISPDYIDHFTPSDDYGMLYPYAAAPRAFAPDYDEEYGKHDFQYGLCTADGTVVTDPIYSAIEAKSGHYLLWQLTPTEEDWYSAKCFYIPADGSFVRLVPVEQRSDMVFTTELLDNGNVLFSRDSKTSGLLFPDGGVKYLVGFFSPAYGYLYGSDSTATILLDLNGDPLARVEWPASLRGVSDRRMILQSGAAYSLVDLNGNRLLPDEYAYVDFSENFVVTVAEERLGDFPYTVTVWDENLKALRRFGLPSIARIVGRYLICDSDYYTLEGKKCGPFTPENADGEYTLAKAYGADLMRRVWTGTWDQDYLDMQGKLLFSEVKGVSEVGSIWQTGDLLWYCFEEYDENGEKHSTLRRYSFTTGETEIIADGTAYGCERYYWVEQDGIHKTYEFPSGRFLCATPEEPLLGSTDAADGKTLLFYTANGVTCSRFADGEIYMKTQSENG